MKRFFRALFLLFVTLSILPSLSSAAESHREKIANEMFAKINTATWIAEGKSEHVVYIIFDPNCPFCHRVFLDTRALVKNNELQLRWIPVGVLTATSHGKAATILDARDPLTAFRLNENKYVRGEGGGGIDEALDGTEKTEKALKANAALLRIGGFDAVPTILFRANDGRAVLIQGAPPTKKLLDILKYVK